MYSIALRKCEVRQLGWVPEQKPRGKHQLALYRERRVISFARTWTNAATKNLIASFVRCEHRPRKWTVRVMNDHLYGGDMDGSLEMIDEQVRGEHQYYGKPTNHLDKPLLRYDEDGNPYANHEANQDAFRAWILRKQFLPELKGDNYQYKTIEEIDLLYCNDVVLPAPYSQEGLKLKQDKADGKLSSATAREIDAKTNYGWNAVAKSENVKFNAVMRQLWGVRKKAETQMWEEQHLWDWSNEMSADDTFSYVVLNFVCLKTMKSPSTAKGEVEYNSEEWNRRWEIDKYIAKAARWSEEKGLWGWVHEWMR